MDDVRFFFFFLYQMCFHGIGGGKEKVYALEFGILSFLHFNFTKKKKKLNLLNFFFRMAIKIDMVKCI